MSPRRWGLLLALTLTCAICGYAFFSVEAPKIRVKEPKKRTGKKLTRKQRSEKRQEAGSNTVVHLRDEQQIERKGDVAADAPNILLVSIDTLRADALKPYGSPLDNAETMAALAEEGVVFQHSWSQAPSTSPTHASMFTSALPSEHGVMGTNGRLPLSWFTLAEHMQSYGVRTWASTSSVRFALGVQLHQGFDDYAVFASGSQHGKTDKALEVALSAISTEPEQPWFGFVHLMDVHAPYDVPEPHQSKFLSGPPSVKPGRTVQFLHRNRTRPKKVSAQQLQDLKSMYAGGVSLVDTRIKDLRDAVQTLKRPTIIIITADHGEAFFERNYLGHGTFVHEPIMRIPLIFWGPGIIPAGAHRSTLSQSIDLYPTISTLMGLPTPDDLRGTDLSPVLMGDGELPGQTVIGQTNKRYMMVRDTPEGTFKILINKRKKAVRMYDIGTDPFEQTNISRAHPERATAWADELRELVQNSKAPAAEQWEMTDEEREALEAIGYMDADD